MKNLLLSVLVWFFLWLGGWFFWYGLRNRWHLFLPWVQLVKFSFVQEIIIGLCVIIFTLLLIKNRLGRVSFLSLQNHLNWLIIPFFLVFIKILNPLPIFRSPLMPFFIRLFVFSSFSTFLQQVINFGYLNEILLKRYSQDKVLILTSTGFALPHLSMFFHSPFIFSLFWTSISFLLGLLFAFLKQKTGSLYPSWSLHWSFYLTCGLFSTRLPIY